MSPLPTPILFLPFLFLPFRKAVKSSAAAQCVQEKAVPTAFRWSLYRGGLDRAAEPSDLFAAVPGRQGQVAII